MTKKGGAKARIAPKKQVVVMQQQPKKKKQKVGTQRALNAVLSRGMGMAGRAAVGMIGRITGMGDYTVKSNSIATTAESISGEVPHFGKADNSTRVRHREFIKDVTVPDVPANFTNSSYVINPSNKELFPWLSKFAENYQQYKVHGMVMYFKSTTSDYSAAGALGKVAMATNYNVRDSQYQNMQELENSEFAVSGKPSVSRLHPIECAPNNGVPLIKWVRDAQYDTTSGGDDRLYDVGKFQFATQGLPGTAGTTIGELWVTYDIEFYKPIVGRESTAAQYTAVSLPVFDGQAGYNTPAYPDLYMTETSTFDFVAYPNMSKEDAWNKLLNPQEFTRLSDLEIDSSKLSYSQYRPSPDSFTTTWPAKWQQTSGTSTSRQFGTLLLSRPGIWHLHYLVKCKPQSSVATDGNSMSRCAYDPSYNSSGTARPPNNWASNKFSGVELQVVDSSGNPVTTQQPSLLGGGFTGGQNFGYVADPVGPGKASAKRNVISWNAVIWVSEQIVNNGHSVKVTLRPPYGFSGPTAPAVAFPDFAEGSTIFSHELLDKATFQISLIGVKSKTYYEPVEAGLTSDDRDAISTGVNSVLALLPKLREFGIC